MVPDPVLGGNNGARWRAVCLDHRPIPLRHPLSGPSIQAEADHLHDARFIARAEVVTIDQRALLAVGELLGDDA